MRRRNALVGLALIAAAALISTAWAGTGAGTAKKKSARGPVGLTGPQGPAGAKGAVGADGTARAFVHVTATDATLPVVDTANSSPAGITLCSNGAGDVLVTFPAATGVVVRNVVVTPDATASTDPGLARTVRVGSGFGAGGGCGAGPSAFRVITSLATTGANKATGFYALIN
jgi:hypothetical protein